MNEAKLLNSFKYISDSISGLYFKTGFSGFKTIQNRISVFFGFGLLYLRKVLAKFNCYLFLQLCSHFFYNFYNLNWISVDFIHFVSFSDSWYLSNSLKTCQNCPFLANFWNPVLMSIKTGFSVLQKSTKNRVFGFG